MENNAEILYKLRLLELELRFMRKGIIKLLGKHYTQYGSMKEELKLLEGDKELALKALSEVKDGE